MDHSYMMIDFWSPWHWIVYVLFAAIVIYPIGRILARLGYSPFWCRSQIWWACGLWRWENGRGRGPIPADASTLAALPWQRTVSL